MTGFLYSCFGGTPRYTKKLPTTTAMLLASDTASAHRVLIIRNFGTVTVFIGESSAVTADGFPLEAGDFHVIEQFRGEIWGITASDTGDLRVANVT